MKTARKIARFLDTAGAGRLWVVVAWADVTGLAWLGEHTRDRSVRLIVDDTRPHMFNVRSIADVSPSVHDSAIRFLERPDVHVYSMERREGSRVHRKNFVIEAQDGGPSAAIVGSPNLSKYGLFHNEETVVEVSLAELPEVWTQTSGLLQRSRPAGDRIATYIRCAQAGLPEHYSSSASIDVSAKLSASAIRLGNELPALLDAWIVHLGVEPCHVRSSSNEIRRRIFGWNGFNTALSRYRLMHPRVRIVQRELRRGDINVNRKDRHGRDMPWIDTTRVYETLNEGGTLVVSAIHECDDALNRVRLNLERLFGIEMGINAYMSLKAERGLGLHWDSHDVLIVQIEGTKHWTIYRPTRFSPLDRDIEHASDEPTDVFVDLVLEPGDLLYIPRGWWHDVVAIDSPSLHLTIGMQWRTIADYLHWLVDRMLESDIVRRDIPRDTLSQEAVLDLVSGMLLHEVSAESGRLEQYLRESTAAIRVPPIASLPFGLDGVPLPDTGELQSNCNGMISFVTTADDIVFEVDDRSFTLPIVCAGLVRQVLEADGSTSVGQIRSMNGSDLSEDDIDRLILRFASDGLISVTLAEPQ